MHSLNFMYFKIIIAIRVIMQIIKLESSNKGKRETTERIEQFNQESTKMLWEKECYKYLRI